MANWTSDLITEIMDEYGIDKNTVPRGFRFQTVHGKGFGHCDKCNHSWASYWIWIKIDLRRAKIDYRFKQKCIKCKNIFRPIVTSDSLEEMVRIVCKRYIALIGGGARTSDKPRPKTDKNPHESELCEKCGYGERKCWLPFQRDEE